MIGSWNKRLRLLFWTIRAWLFTFGIIGLAAIPAHAQHHRSFTVDDTIQYERLVDPHEFGEGRGIALFSPNAERFVVRTRRADIVRDGVVETVSIYKAANLSCPDAGELTAASVAPERQFSFLTKSSRDVSHLRWLNSDELAMVAPDQYGVGQIFVLNSVSGAERQITHSRSGVVSFATREQTVLFYARAKPDIRSSAQRITEKGWDQILFPDVGIYQNYYQSVDLHKTSLAGGPEQRFGGGARLLSYYNQDISISPDQRHAVILVPAINWPDYWEEYEVADPELFRFERSQRTADANSPKLVWRPRYALLNLQTGQTTPLLDAPLATLSGNGTPRRIFWSSDSRRVIVSATWLPLGLLSGPDRSHARQRPATVEVDIGSRAVLPIVWEPTSNEVEAFTGPKPGILDFHWDAAREQLTVIRKGRSGGQTRETFHHRGGLWFGTERASARSTEKVKLPDVRVEQSLVDPPQLVATHSNCKRVVLTPNPYLDGVELAEMDRFTWVDSSRRKWSAGLLLPQGYKPGEKYPLVVQTHGFDASEFLVDGPSGSAFAARALAAAGFVVIQIEDQAGISVSDEPAAYAAGYRAAIRSLVDRGIVDPKRVGAIGFSATGLYLQEMLVREPTALSALILSDTGYYGYVSHVLALNSSPTFLKQYDIASQGPVPWTKLDDIGPWIARNRFYDFAKSDVPMRVEAMGPTALMYNWEIYALRRHLGKPTDLIYYPLGEHSLYTPSERRMSLEGTVDWFRFWLLGQEDHDPAKEDQYIEWRRMKNLKRLTK